MDTANFRTIDAITEIHAIAARHNLAISIVTVDDVLGHLGIGVLERTDDVRDKVQTSWEWRHYGDGWADWFRDMDTAQNNVALSAGEIVDELRSDEEEYQARDAELQAVEDERADDQARWELDR